MRAQRLAFVVVVAAALAAGAFLLPSISSASSARASLRAPLTAREAQALSTNVTDHVIVLFKNQVSSIPDSPANRARRASAVAGVQQPVVSELRQTHATDVQAYSLINAVAAKVSPGEAQRLAANPAVAQVVPDLPIPIAKPTLPTVQRGLGGGSSGGTLAEACAPDGKVQLDPQAVETIHAAEPGGGLSAQSLGYTGAGVKVGFIADGLDVDDPDFIRADGQHVFVDYQDFSGTGTSAPTGGGEAFLDASSIAAQGREVYNLDEFNSALPSPCNIRILGVAPGASLVGLNVFGSSDFAFNSVFLEAINYAVNVDHVQVLNESFGGNPFPDQGNLDLLKTANDAAVAAGVTVDVSSGDAGITDTIGSPATDPDVISAGASTTYRAYAQADVGAIDSPGVTGWLDNNISGLSSAGYDQDGGTVDIVAPGDLNWALCSSSSQYADCGGLPFQLSGGTSEAAPLTSGVAALVIQAYERTHGGAAPTPAVVKQIIVSTAQDISAPADQQGAGLLDAYAAVRAAAAYQAPNGHGWGSDTGGELVKSATQLTAVGGAGTPESFSDTVTNTGSSPQLVGLSSRTLSPYQQVAHTTVQINDAGGDEATVHFVVPRGQARLDASIAYVAASTSSGDFTAADNLSLISPSGRLAEYNLPQGAGNYGDAEVANPQPGTWTALIYNSAPSSDGGSVGPVQFQASTATWQPLGRLSTRLLALGPHQSRSFTLTTVLPAAPGDASGSIVLTSLSPQPAFARTTTVPVTLRTLIPTPNPTTSFTGTLTGGNGRETNTGVTEYYEVNIPAGTKELNASIASPSSANTVYAELIDPVTGEAASTASSGVPTASGAITPETGVQLHVLSPDAGRWTLAINFYNQVSGTALTQPFTVTLDSRQVPVTAAALPDSASTNLPSGKPVTVPVKVTNTGSVPEAYFTDARLDQSTQLSLQALTTSSLTVPIDSTNIPLYLVPTHTTSITASASGTAPFYFDFWSSFGDPDVISNVGFGTDNPSGTYSASPVWAGEWGVTPFQNGPDGTNGVPPETVHTAITATTEAFDSAVSSPTGDLWERSTNPSASLTPVVVDPGQSATIPVTITPSGASGTVVNGTLYVDDTTLVNGEASYQELAQNLSTASDLAAIPYEYTVR